MGHWDFQPRCLQLFRPDYEGTETKIIDLNKFKARSDPTMRGRLNSGFWVVGHGSSTKFGKVTVTDAELSTDEKATVFRLNLEDWKRYGGRECSLRKAEATL
jgi:hypothetical protein